MKKLTYCSTCGEKNEYNFIDGNTRYHCKSCKNIHYQNPKPTATLICPEGNQILLVKRAVNPGKGKWSLPGGFLELGETLEQGASRELKEETNLKGKVVNFLENCSHFNSIFGDILLLGLLVKIEDWSKLKAGDDAMDAKLFNINDCPPLAFECHQKILNAYLKIIK